MSESNLSLAYGLIRNGVEWRRAIAYHIQFDEEQAKLSALIGDRTNGRVLINSVVDRAEVIAGSKLYSQLETFKSLSVSVYERIAAGATMQDVMKWLDNLT